MGRERSPICSAWHPRRSGCTSRADGGTSNEHWRTTMTKIERELARLDALDVPPLEREIRERAVGTEVRLDLPSRSAGSRIVAGATALLLFAAVSVLVWRAFQPADTGRLGVTPAPAADPWAGYPAGWTTLPEPP